MSGAQETCIPFKSLADASEIEAFVIEHEKDERVYKWALYIERGPKQNVTLRDGLKVQGRFMHSGPKAPFRGFLFLRAGNDIEDERERALRDEVNTIGTHNIAVRYARKSDIKRAVRVALME